MLKKYINKKILPLEAPCGAQDLDVCDDSGVCDDLIVKTTIVLPLSNVTKTNFDITWEKFINKRQHNINKRKEVKRYDSKSYIRTRHPKHLYEGLLRYNGQNNSKFYGETRFWGFYSELQEAAEETIMMREHEKKCEHGDVV